MNAPDFIEWLRKREAWSLRTFGPGQRTAGVIAHIRKELNEILAQPDDLEEWVDVLLLAFDGAYRAGHPADEVLAALVAKHAKNEARKWPPVGSVSPDKPVEHIEAPTTCAACPVDAPRPAVAVRPVPNVTHGTTDLDLCDVHTAEFDRGKSVWWVGPPLKVSP